MGIVGGKIRVGGRMLIHLAFTVIYYMTSLELLALGRVQIGKAQIPPSKSKI